MDSSGAGENVRKSQLHDGNGFDVKYSSTIFVNVYVFYMRVSVRM